MANQKKKKKVNEPNEISSSELKGQPPKEWMNPKFGTHHFIQLKVRKKNFF